MQERFRYRDFTDRRWGRGSERFLYGRAWTHAEGLVALFNHAVTWLRKNQVLLPGVSVPARQVSEDDGSAEAAMREKLGLRCNTVRPFLSLPGESEALDAAPVGRRILRSVRRRPALSRRRAVFSNANCPRAPSTGTRTWCACWSGCTAR
nr:DUF4158 domain-containing protein [Streptomyces bambusae]